jgi:hypothetical protein
MSARYLETILFGGTTGDAPFECTFVEPPPDDSMVLSVLPCQIIGEIHVRKPSRDRMRQRPSMRYVQKLNDSNNVRC